MPALKFLQRNVSDAASGPSRELILALVRQTQLLHRGSFNIAFQNISLCLTMVLKQIDEKYDLWPYMSKNQQECKIAIFQQRCYFIYCAILFIYLIIVYLLNYLTRLIISLSHLNSCNNKMFSTRATPSLKTKLYLTQPSASVNNVIYATRFVPGVNRVTLHSFVM